MTRLPAIFLAVWWLGGQAVAGDSAVQVSLSESRLCLPRKSVEFVVRNASADTVEVGLSVERQDSTGKWTFFQESIGTSWTSKMARVWTLEPGQEDRPLWPAGLAQHGRFAPGRYRVIVSVHVNAKTGVPRSELGHFVGPEFGLQTCQR